MQLILLLYVLVSLIFNSDVKSYIYILMFIVFNV